MSVERFGGQPPGSLAQGVPWVPGLATACATLPEGPESALVARSVPRGHLSRADRHLEADARERRPARGATGVALVARCVQAADRDVRTLCARLGLDLEIVRGQERRDALYVRHMPLAAWPLLWL